MGERLSGRCLCGAVKYTAEPKSLEMAVCHCGMCRRWTGGVFMDVDCGTSVEIEDQSAVSVYQSSDWMERVFCGKCGTHLLWRMRDGSHSGVTVNTFDDPSVFKFTTEIFIKEKPGNYTFADKTRKLTGAEVVAMFAPKD